MKPFNVVVILIFLCLSHGISTGQVKGNERLSPSLKNTLFKKKAPAILEIFITVTDLSKLKAEKDVQLIAEYKNTNTALVRISSAKLLSLIGGNEIIFADEYRKPKDELTTGALDISLNNISYSHNSFPLVNGEAINISLKEQRFDSGDIDIKGRVFETGLAADLQSSHAAIMATIIAGAGNTSPFAKGAAWGGRLTSSDYATLLPDADDIYRQYKLSVQNHSYGTGIENYYGADAASYDMSVWNNPALLHVFSAGNSGTGSPGSGIYSGIPGIANLTGSFKMAKNIITVGATDSFNIVASLSSRGPAFDGRVKPDLVVFGEDGSSGAAALVSGTAALVQQAYKDQYNSLPPAALVKAVLLNSADDIGEKHVDFISGYGSLNAYAAVNTIEQKRFLIDSVAQNEIEIFPIAIPPGIAKLKITVTWTDTAAIPNAKKTLVNDIDAVLELSATNESWHPWVLSSYPHKDSLLLAAARKRDTLNNTEQITLDNPHAGNYALIVKGSNIKTSVPQAFAIACQLDTLNNFAWTFPTSTDVLIACEQNVLRWETNITGAGTIEYSTNGINWQTVGVADLSAKYFKWNVPDTMSSAFLRMKFTSLPAVGSPNFLISEPVSMQTGFDCPDSFLLYWNGAKASQYQIYRLANKYLEPMQTIADSFIVLQKQAYPGFYYSVAPLVGSRPGARSFTINYSLQGAGCFVKTFFALLQNANTAFLTAEMGSLYHVAEISFQKITATGVRTLNTVANPSTLTLNFSDSQLSQGVNQYRLQVKFKDGGTVYSNTDQVYYFPANPVLVYPNPSKSDEPIRILAQDPGIYFISIYDTNGRLLHQSMLHNIFQSLKELYLPPGVYFVRVVADNGKTFTQKLVVY